jgi:hypothetical protein
MCSFQRLNVRAERDYLPVDAIAILIVILSLQTYQHPLDSCVDVTGSYSAALEVVVRMIQLNLHTSLQDRRR